MKNVSICDVMSSGGILIPRIQRDYAQGRKDEDGLRVQKSFIPRLFRAVFEGKQLSLDFVYGIGEAGEGETYRIMLLDGQQRLTTLYLLSWFCGKDISDWKFSYESRRVADEFMNKLKTCRCTDPADPVAIIKKQDWYLPSFNDDPTVAASIQMLKAMSENYLDMYQDMQTRQSVLKNAKLDNISFLVKDISRIQQGQQDMSFDEIYLKMNARGLPLTEWENIKAILDKYSSEEWKISIAKWEEDFWQKITKDDIPSKIENWNCALEKIIRCCYEALCGNYHFDLSELEERVKNDKKFYGIASKYFEAILTGDVCACWSEYRDVNMLWGGCGSQDFWEDFLFNNRIPSLQKRLRLYALIRSCNNIERQRRIVLNVVDCSERLDVAQIIDYKSAVDKFFEDSLSAASISALKMFSQRQVEEECWKAQYPEIDICRLESKKIVWHGSIGFLDVRGRNVETVEYCANVIERRIDGDACNFVCDLIRDLRNYNADDVLHESIPMDVELPYLDHRIWAQKIFYRDEFRKALKCNLLGHYNNVEGVWLSHLREFLARSHGHKYFHVKTFDDGWTYLYSQSRTERPRRTPGDSVRLDYNEVEKRNREIILGGSEVRFDFDYVETLNKGEWVNVKDESWWTIDTPRRYSKEEVDEIRSANSEK